MTCSCPIDGFCSRYNRTLNVRQHSICNGTSGLSEERAEQHRQAWLAAQTPDEPAKKPAKKTDPLDTEFVSGPGTELTKIIDWLGIQPTKQCKCKLIASIMDRHGPDWCEKNIDRLVDLIQKEADRRELPFSAVRPYFIRLAIKKAIRRSRTLARSPESIPASTV